MRFTRDSRSDIKPEARPCGTSALLSPAKGPVNGRATFRPLGSHKRRKPSRACAKERASARVSHPMDFGSEIETEIGEGKVADRLSHFGAYSWAHPVPGRGSAGPGRSPGRFFYDFKAILKQNLHITRPTAPRWKALTETCQKTTRKGMSAVQAEGQGVGHA